MKKLFILIGVLLVIVSCQSPSNSDSKWNANEKKITFDSGDLSISISDDLKATLLFQAESIAETDQELISLWANGEKVNLKIDISKTQIDSFSDSLGTGDRAKAFAEGKLANGTTIEQELRLTVFDRYPNSLIIETSFTNNDDSRPIKIDSVSIGHLALNSTLSSQGGSNPFDFHTFQGAARQWGLQYANIPVTKDFNRTNFMGLYDRHRKVDGDEDEGGGINLIDVWNKDMGVSVSHLATKDLFVYFPTVVDNSGLVHVAMTENPDPKIGRENEIEPGETFRVQAPVAITLHTGDYYEPLSIHKEMLQDLGVDINEEAPAYMYDAYWKTWGWRFDFTMDMIYERIPVLKELGIDQVMVDAGWFPDKEMGDWEPDPAKYPNGEADIIASVKKMKELGASRVYIWWNPLAAGVESRVFANKDWIVMGEDGEANSDLLHSLCPAYPPVQEYIRQTVTKFIKVWGYDGVYNDFAMNSVAPLCYNPAHNHEKPTDAYEATPEVFRIIWETAHELHDDPFIENCMCSLPHSLFKNPYTNLTSSSDPTETHHIRNRIKVEKSTHGPTWPYNTYIEQGIAYGKTQTLEELDVYFATIVGTGTIPTSLMGELVPERFEYYKKWFEIYRKEKFSDGEYLNLYDIAYDKPEAHVNKKDSVFYYGFYEDNFSGKIELRGLQEGVRYSVTDYVNKEKIGEVDGADASIQVDFSDYLLVKCEPVSKNKTIDSE